MNGSLSVQCRLAQRTKAAKNRGRKEQIRVAPPALPRLDSTSLIEQVLIEQRTTCSLSEAALFTFHFPIRARVKL